MWQSCKAVIYSSLVADKIFDRVVKLTDDICFPKMLFNYLTNNNKFMKNNVLYPIRNLSSWQRLEWLEFIGRPSISVEGHHRLIIGIPIISNAVSAVFPMLASSEMPGILCFKIVGIPIKAGAAQLSFNVFPLTNQYWHHYWTNAGFPSLSRMYVHIYILCRHWQILATRRPMPAQYLAIFGIKWMTMHDRIPGLPLSC